MNCWRTILLIVSVALPLVSCCTASQAAIILLKNRDEPVVGMVVRDEKERIVVRTVGPDGKPHEEVIPRSDIEEILPSVSTDRLVDLEPAKPAGYRDYAEELWARRKDPEARDMAIRLNLIAAWLDPEKLGRSALLALVSLARTPQERQRFEAALYLIDPRTPLSAVDVPATRPAAADSSAAQELLRALRLLRTGKGSTARALAEKPAVAALLETYSRLLTRAEFNAASGQATLSTRELRQCLLLELELESLLQGSTGGERTATTLAWSRELQGDGGKAVPSLALETLTEFDLRKCRYRDGKWVEK